MNDIRKCLTAVTLVMSFLSSYLVIDAQQNESRVDETLPEEIASIARHRQEQIERELANSQSSEWAGVYGAIEDLTTSVMLFWTPASGFMVWRESCSRPGVAQVNYGSVNFNGSSLTPSPERTERNRHTYDISSGFVPVRWGEQHWLIPSDKLILFCYAINSGSFEEIESFFLKAGDNEKPREGLPEVPSEYKKYLGVEPIEAEVSAVGTRNERWYPPLTLNVGRAEGVVAGMKFYLIKSENINMHLDVTDVREHTSVTRVVMAGVSGDNDDEIRPAVGWKFSSRLPEGSW
ncbi:MAG TPA: hypothetical protein VF708_12895 [Pyrinomonadaceae bacterium]|jgi:hypothetical protein